MKKCPKCGTKADDDDIYCPECGTKLKAVKKEIKESVVKKITVWSILKIMGIIILLIITANIFKNPAPVIIAFFLLLLWLNVINKLLTKIFNIELSLGVKILITVAIIFLAFIATSQTTSIQPIVETQREVIRETREDILEENALFDGVKQLEKALRQGDWAFLDGLVVSNRISKEVYEDFAKVLNEKGSLNIVFEVKGEGIKKNWATLEVQRIIIYNDGGRQGDMSKWELTKYNGKWQLISMSPLLSDLVFSGRGALSIKTEPLCQNGICLTPAKTDVAIGSLRKI